MKTSIPTTVTMAIAALMIGFAPTAMQGEVTRVEISSREDVLGGKAFGTSNCQPTATSVKPWRSTKPSPKSASLAGSADPFA